MKGWLRLHRSILSAPKIQRLPAEQFRTLINLWCIADENTGVLPKLEDISFLLRLNYDATTVLLSALLEANLMNKGPGGRYAVHDWQNWQYQSDTSTSRVRKHREKRSTGTQRNVSVTPSEAETEAEQNRTENTHTAREEARTQMPSRPPTQSPPPGVAFDGFGLEQLIRDLHAQHAASGLGDGGGATRTRVALVQQLPGILARQAGKTEDEISTGLLARHALWCEFWRVERQRDRRAFVALVGNWLADETYRAEPAVQVLG